MKASKLTLLGGRLATLAVILMIACSATLVAQQTYVVNGFVGAGQQTVPSYSYVYNYPNEYYYFSDWNYFSYDYMTSYRQQYIVTAADMRAAGMCAGPISSMAYRFVRAIRFDMDITISLKQVPATTTFLNTWQTGLTQVYNNPAFTLNPIALNDSTWVDWPFQTNFTWDGTSNLVVNLCRLNRTGNYTYNQLGSQYLLTHVRPPNPPFNYTGQYPYLFAYGYAFNGTPTCTPAYGPYIAYMYSYSWVTYINEYKAFRPLVRFKSETGVTQSFPDEVDPRRITKAGDVYNGSDALHPKPSITFFQSAGASYSFNYRIVGPLPATNTVYQALSGGSSTINHTAATGGSYTYTFGEASGIYASANGDLNLASAVGGAYRVEVDFTSSCGVSSWRKAFIVAFPNDVALSGIRSPQPVPKKNPININLPLAAQIQNVGLNPVTNVDVTAVVKNSSNQTVFTGTTNWTGTLQTGDRANVDFPAGSFIPNQAGLYTVTMCANLKSAIDQQAINDCLPSTGQVHTFAVNYNEEAGAGTIQIPASNGRYFANRPLRPEGTIINGGILDLTDVPVKMEIYKGTGRQNKVYTQTVIVPSVDAVVPINIALVQFPLFYPADAGQYEVCMTVMLPGDQVTSNDVTCQMFTVDANLSGTYTIGTLKQGQARNYSNFDLAIDDLYLKGVSGPVTFELTDATYTIGLGLANQPALDLSGKIIGVSSTNTISFVPSLDRSLTRGSVAITLNSATGQGVLFGQALVPTNTNSVARQFPYVRQFSNSDGYITFDGGIQKSLKFELMSTSPHRSAFYMMEGSRNISVKNSIITNSASSSPSWATSLPRVYFLSGSFQFESDLRNILGVPTTYSAGIVNRAKLPVGITGNNGERLDTITNVSNKFIGNDISGFGYGVVSLGMGTLIKGGVNTYLPYYNTGTEITSNLISNVTGAGIYVGYEDGALINKNRIYNVGRMTGGAVKDAAGIYAGGNVQYNNMDLKITANEISAVKGDSVSRGIVIDQTRNGYSSISSSGGTYYAPNREEHSVVTSNAVWGIARNLSTGSAAGIHLLTQRSLNSLYTPFAADYFTRKDTVANNTVYLQSDGLVGAGYIVGIGSQHGNGTVIMNNAIALEAGAGAATGTQSALLFEGILFEGGLLNRDYLPTNAPNTLISDRNAFWTPNSGIARFVEVSQLSEIVSTGSQTEFSTLAQWRNWSKNDKNSVYGNFVAQHEFQGIAPNQRLRVNITPAPPIGSILNNRGARLSSVSQDIDGQPRGGAGLGYDIGADEFDGRLYISDLEALDVTKPASYRSATGVTSDAEYIMTKAPVDVTALIRNNGALANNNANIRVRVYLETAASNNAALTTPQWNAVPVVDRVVTTALGSGESKDVMFNIPNWTPQTYFGMFGYTVPTRFATMTANVTPRYRIEVSTTSDEFNPNNTFTKDVRFYLQKSGIRAIVSARGSATSITSGTPTTNDMAGRLNYDSLAKYMLHIGWVNDPAIGQYAYDVFERSAWEERAVDYRAWRTLFWSHDQSALTRYERDDMRNFLNAGSPAEKKNLVMGSQEPPRRHVGLTVANDQAFVNRVLRVSNVAPGTPIPPPVNTYHGKRITGATIARNSTETIVRTGFTDDADPIPALVRIYSDATTSGIANPAYIYMKGDRTTLDSIMGSATQGLNTTTVYLGVDWRHYNRTGPQTGGERVLRGTIDFIQTNGGIVLPVELTAFDAKARGNDVDVFWSTMSESNSDHFVVERASITAAGTSSFEAVSTVPAGGNTTTRRDYQIADNNLTSGQYLYRLSTVDGDGTIGTSGEVLVTVDAENGALWLGAITPNPVTNEASVTFGLQSAGVVDMVLVDLNGREVLTVVSQASIATSSSTTFNVNNLPAGAYTLVLRSGGMVVSKPLTIVK